MKSTLSRIAQKHLKQSAGAAAGERAPTFEKKSAYEVVNS